MPNQLLLELLQMDLSKQFDDWTRSNWSQENKTIDASIMKLIFGFVSYRTNLWFNKYSDWFRRKSKHNYISDYREEWLQLVQ